MSMMRIRQRAIKKTEDRVTTMGEILKCIRLIKMNAWEEAFQNKVDGQFYTFHQLNSSESSRHPLIEF